MKKKTYNDEMDLSDLFFNLWNNKIKILVITTAFLISGYIYYSASNKNYIATTNIKPISTFESQKYKLYNSLTRGIVSEKTVSEETPEVNIITISSQSLLDLFISKIQTAKIIEEGLIKFKLINKDNFINEKDYNEAIKQNAILIIDQMTRPYEDENDKEKSVLYWQYNFKVSDKLSWRNFLEHIEKQANEEIRQSLISRFNTDLEILSNSSKFKLEDIDQSIANELDDYKISINNRLAFLKEQAQIARTLNISKNTLEVENFQTDNTIVTNIKSESSYYLKGFETIEKEINLINSRENEKLFIPNLIELENIKRSILQDKSVERLKLLFSKSPITNKSEFVAAKIDYLTTTYRSEKSLKKILSLSLVTGLLISFMYIFFNKAITVRK